MGGLVRDLAIAGGLHTVDLSGCRNLLDAHVQALFEGNPLLRHACFARARHLQHPTVVGGALVSLSLAQCTGMRGVALTTPRLAEVSVAGCRLVSGDALADIVDALPRLQFLDASSCTELKHVTVESTTLQRLVLSMCTGLRSLLLDAPSLQSLALGAVPCLQHLEVHAGSNLRSLDLSVLVGLQSVELEAPQLKVARGQRCGCPFTYRR